MPPLEPQRPQNERRVLLLTPTSRDATASLGVLSGAGVNCAPCFSIEQVCHELEGGAAAVVLPEEVVQSPGGGRFARLIAEQPVWSDLPVILLAAGGLETAAVTAAMQTLGNVSIIERPVRISTL